MMGPNMPQAPFALTILIPIYDDAEALVLLLDRVDVVLGRAGWRAQVLVVDDGSPKPLAPVVGRCWSALDRVEALELRANVGHQRAIAIGLAWLEQEGRCDGVVVMDGDGEDAPEDIPPLVRRASENGFSRIVFAERTKRSETVAFRACYWLYRQVHYALTGVRVRVGNFSVIPRRLLSRLVVSSHMWNHYAATVFKTRVPFESIRTARAKRLAGESRMNFVSLGVHGLSALSVFGEVIGVRLGLAAAAGIAAAAVALIALVWRGPATLSVGLAGILVGLLLQTGGFLLLFVFLTLRGRNDLGFLPARDYPHFVGRLFALYAGAAEEHREELRALGAGVGRSVDAGV